VHAGGGDDIVIVKSPAAGRAGSISSSRPPAGINLIDGGTGADVMVGGSGNETYMVDDRGDHVLERPAAGIDRVLARIDYTLPINIENLTLTGAAHVGIGNRLSNQLVGNNAANTLQGLEGNDTLDGGKGIDSLEGGIGNDTYVVDNARDMVTDTGGTDTIAATVSYALQSVAPIERLKAATAAATTAMTLTGSSGANTITGNNGVNTLKGLGGNDTLLGLSGNDALSGSIGNDKLTGGLGRDILTGGPGADIFDFNSVRESVRGPLRDIVRFSHPERDKIDLSTIDADTDGTGGNQGFKFIGTTGFHGIDGELRFAGGLLQGDTNGDKVADIEIRIVGALTRADIIL
jgi:Ca2+-binding RTX toxin-like protein